MKFEEELHIWSLNSTTNYFWGQICFMDFAIIMLCTTSSSCYLQNRTFFKYIGKLILLFCLSVCLSVYRRQVDFKPIFTKLHHMVMFVIRKKVFEEEEGFLCLRSKGQHRPKVNNWGGISKILNFHPIDLKFEEDLHIWSLNSTTNYFWGQICFMDFASIVLCMASSFCYLQNRRFFKYIG